MSVASPSRATVDDDPDHSDRTTAFQRARRRRDRRHAKLTERPVEPFIARVRDTARRMPFILALVTLLGGGLVGVLWLNTLTDEAGIQANDAKRAVTALQLQIQGADTDIASRNATPMIAQAASSLGLVPAGDAAILLVPGTADPSAAPTEVGTPSAVVDPSIIAEQEAQASAAAAADEAAAASAAAASESAASAAAASAATATSAAAPSAAADPNADPNVAVTTTAQAVPVDQPPAQDAGEQQPTEPAADPATAGGVG